MSEPIALVVGGSGGLGGAVAEALARDGQPVCLTWSRHAGAAEATAVRIREAGGRATVRQLTLPRGDPGDLADVGSLVFCAGPEISQPPVGKADPDALGRAFAIEVQGLLVLAQAALPALRRHRGSVVALVTAGLGRWPPGDVLSVAPKAAVEALVRGLAREEGRHGVRANAVAVGVVEAGMFHRIGFGEDWLAAARRNIALRRFARAAEVAEVVAFLASDRASYVTGQTLYVDGGYTV